MALVLALTSCRPVAADSARLGSLRPGDEGAGVVALQERLSALGYWLGTPDGRYGTSTTQAVFALQKAAGLPRDGEFGLRTALALDQGVRPAATTFSGRFAEVHLATQLLLLVRDGRVEHVVNASTGIEATATPAGDFSVYRAVDAWDSGPYGPLYRPRYFVGGVAVHGYRSVPPQPASHGCVRVSIAAMDWLWSSGWLELGTPVTVR
ncbi:L,D-transpeptidase family protein [Nonomuraea sp. NPDC050663]|uniref:L,D-transpeptidase family protein n=1 Tax=Nonomuraea sp. NPDC050663 TaxID=3364370 RepID=UPI0037B9BA8E